MTREEAKELLPIIQAFVKGKKVEQKEEGLTNWYEIDDDLEFSSITKHRIKPELKYRPFKTQEECWEEMHKHPDFGWVKFNVTQNKTHISGIETINENLYIILSTNKGWNTPILDIFNDYTFTDGTPFGVKEE